MVVLVVLALAVAVTIPALNSGRGAELRSAARSVAAALRQTRNEAVTRGSQQVLEVDVQRRLVTLPAGGRRLTLPAWLQVELYTARSELTGEGRGGIRFFPDGSSTGGRVTLGGSGAPLHIEVEWLTGRIRILEANEAPAVEDNRARTTLAADA